MILEFAQILAKSVNNISHLPEICSMEWYDDAGEMPMYLRQLLLFSFRFMINRKRMQVFQCYLELKYLLLIYVALGM